MWVLMVEAFVALFLLVFIVWWTLPAKKKPAPKAPPSPAAGDSGKDGGQP